MKKFQAFIKEVAEPKAGDEKRFKDKHVVNKTNYPGHDDDPGIYNGTKKSPAKKKRLADMEKGKDEEVYEEHDGEDDDDDDDDECPECGGEDGEHEKDCSLAEGMDPVNQKALKKKFSARKDKDIDNDGDVDSSDEYLHKRRKAISKAVKVDEFHAPGMAPKTRKKPAPSSTKKSLAAIRKKSEEVVVENYRQLALKGIGAETKNTITVGRGVDYYSPKDGSKHMGKITKVGKTDYELKDDKTGKTYKFKFWSKEAAKDLVKTPGLAADPSKPAYIGKKKTYKEEVVSETASAAEMKKILKIIGPTKNAQQGIAAIKKALKVSDKKAEQLLDAAIKHSLGESQIDEISKDMAGRYSAKASNQVGSSMKRNMSVKKVDNRYQGIKRASEILANSFDLDEKKGALHLYDNEEAARKKAKEVGGKVIRGVGKSAGKWAVKESVIDEAIAKSQMYALTKDKKIVAKGSKRDMERMQKKEGGTIYLSPSKKVGDMVESIKIDEAQKLFMFKTKQEADQKAKEIKGKVLALGPRNFAVVTMDLTVVKEEEIFLAQFLLDEGVNVDDLTEEQLDELIGAVARGVGAVAKGAARLAKRAVVNKQGNVRFSTAGRADSAERKAGKLEKKKEDQERLKRAKERLKKAQDELRNSYVPEEMSDAQMKKREEIVKSMKSKTDDFKKRYGDRWKEVMYATATKQAMSEGFFKVDIEGLPKFFMDAPSADRVKVELRKILKRPNDMITSIDRVQRAEIIKTFRLQAQGKGDDVVGMEPTEESVIHEGDMKLKDGSTIKLTTEQAKLLNNLYKNLNGSNKKKMEEKMMSDKTSFSEIINFAREAV